MLDVTWIRDKIQSDQFYFSKHGDMERQNDNLTLLNIRHALLRILTREVDNGKTMQFLRQQEF